MNALIIEDERKAASELRQLVMGLRPEWKMAEAIPSVREAVAWLKDNPMPGIIFSDIQLADGECFRIFEQVKVDCPIIFCTAYDEYAMKAFEVNGIDYLLKPVDKTRLEKALQKLDNFKTIFTGNNDNIYAKLGSMIGQSGMAASKSLLVTYQDKIIPVKYADVSFFYYNQGVIMIRLNNNTTYHTTMTMEQVEAGANPHQFYRANRQFMVNRNTIQDIERFFARKLVIKLQTATPEKIIVSKARASHFLAWLEEGN